jgi:hypothetical protein
VFSSLRSLRAGDVANASLRVADVLGSVRCYRWAGGRLEADSIRSLNVTGRGRGAAGVPGDFTGLLIANGRNVPARRYALAAARIAGDLAGSVWDITGDLGRLVVGGSAVGSTIRSTGGMAALSFMATEDSNFLAGIDEAVTDHAALASDFVNPEATIRSIQVRGRRLKRDDPTRFVTNTSFSAATILSTRLINTNGGDACGLYALAADGKEIRTVSYRDTLTGERWSWRSGRGEPPIFGSLTLKAISE